MGRIVFEPRGATDNMDEAPNEVICSERDRAGLIRLNRPKALNALTLGMIRGLETFTHACAKNPHIYGIVMEAEGKGFCAGGDIRTVSDWGQNSPKRGGPVLYRGISAQLDASVFSQAARGSHKRRHDGRRRRGMPLRHAQGCRREHPLRHARDRDRLCAGYWRLVVFAAHAGEVGALSWPHGPGLRPRGLLLSRLRDALHPRQASSRR